MMLAIYFERQISGGSGSGSSSRRSSLRMSGDGPSSCGLIYHNNNNKGEFKEPSSLPPLSMTPGRHPLSCSICRDKYKNPKVLPCLHTFCEACLISYLPLESLTLTCPECRQQSILPLEGISALQTNFCVSTLSGPSCPFCQGKAKATLKCHDCDLDMCPPCSLTHAETATSKTHQISPLGPDASEKEESLLENKTDLTATPRYLLCPSHAGQTLRFFCRDCDTAICSSCTDIEHRRHSVTRAMEAVSEEKTRLTQLVSGVTSKLAQLEGSIALADEAAGSLSQRKEVVKGQISEGFSNLKKALEEREAALLLELEEAYEARLESIRQTKSLLSQHIEEARSCCGLTETALSGQNNETEVLFLKKQIGERLESYCDLDLNPSLLREELGSAASLEVDELSPNSLDLRRVGRLVSGLQRGWALSGECLESRCVPLGRRQFLRLTAPSPVKGEELHVSASMKEVVFSLEEVANGDGRGFLLRFLVSRVGPFSISVKVRNQHISGSPFEFHAYDSVLDDRSASSSPGPFHLHYAGSSVSATNSPTGSGSMSRIPTRANGHNHYAHSPRSRVSTPTNKYHQNGHLKHNSSASAISSRRSTTCPLEDDLILKIGIRGRGRGEFTNPQGVTSLPGRIVVTDSNNQCVQAFDTTGEIRGKFGVRGRTVGQLQRPVGIAYIPGSGNIAVSDYDNRWISIFDPNGKFMSRIGHGKLLGPKGLAADGKGNIYVVDNKASQVLIFGPGGKLIRRFGSRGSDEGQFAGPHFIAVNSVGNIIVTDFHNHCVKVFDQDGDYLFSFGSNGEGNGQFNAPTGVAVDKNDNILVADWGNSRIQIFDSQGTFQGYVCTTAEPLYGPQGLTVTQEGYVAIADSGNHCVKLYKYG